MSEGVKVVEVGPRDGLQNEKKQLSVEERVELIKALQAAGLKNLEGGSFVSPKAIPQMQNSEQVWRFFEEDASIDLSFLVPNQRGFDGAFQSGVRSISFFSATSDEFNRKNIRMSVEESLESYRKIADQAKSQSMRMRGYVSTAFGCPYEGEQSLERLVKVVRDFFEMGCEEVSVGDTIGVAHPKQCREVFSRLVNDFGAENLAAHMHDTRGMAIANIATALDCGIRVFDSSIGGLGGCPYAAGASGNVATEEVVWFLEGQGLETGVNLEALLLVCQKVENLLGRSLSSKLYLAKPKKLFYFSERK